MAILNITYGGFSADYARPIGAHVSDADIRRIAVEAVRTGAVPGLHLPRLGVGAFDQHVVDRFKSFGGRHGAAEDERIYLRPTVPFG